MRSLHPMRATKPQVQKKLQVEAVARNSDLADRYNIAAWDMADDRDVWRAQRPIAGQAVQ